MYTHAMGLDALILSPDVILHEVKVFPCERFCGCFSEHLGAGTTLARSFNHFTYAAARGLYKVLQLLQPICD